MATRPRPLRRRPPPEGEGIKAQTLRSAEQFNFDRSCQIDTMSPLRPLHRIMHWLLNWLNGIEIRFFRRLFDGRKIRSRRLWLRQLSGVLGSGLLGHTYLPSPTQADTARGGAFRLTRQRGFEITRFPLSPLILRPTVSSALVCQPRDWVLNSSAAAQFQLLHHARPHASRGYGTRREPRRLCKECRSHLSFPCPTASAKRRLFAGSSRGLRPHNRSFASFSRCRRRYGRATGLHFG